MTLGRQCDIKQNDIRRCYVRQNAIRQSGVRLNQIIRTVDRRVDRV